MFNVHLIAEGSPQFTTGPFLQPFGVTTAPKTGAVWPRKAFLAVVKCCPHPVVTEPGFAIFFVGFWHQNHIWKNGFV